ncbi:hypothetical protein ANCDUO_19560 [Ancylostoma duodenale]|uniref:Bestrophin homolog n=1 Tax=Ancylostoma duodenale TaxID=51022 RepID=A0A0C2C2A7_9BILA|nr:hypothetical protein ANCDUO_19560 [Ancylostoma duodenale]
MDQANVDPEFPRYWMPLLWIAQTLKKYYKPQFAEQNRKMLQLTRVRMTMGDILCYDWIPIPLANTQTITFAVYSYLIVDGILQHYPLCT